MPKKLDQLGVRWDPAIKERWEKFAADVFHEEASVLARGVLEEFMACFIPDGELISVGLINRIGNRPGGYLCYALQEAAQIQSPSIERAKQLINMLEAAGERAHAEHTADRKQISREVKGSRAKAS